MRGYLGLSRTHTYSLLFAVPLLLLYELGAAWIARGSGTALRNGADVLLRTLFAAGGVRGTLAFTGVLVGGAALFILIEFRRERVPLRASVFAAMALESVVYAVLFGLVVGTITRWALEGVGARLAADAALLTRLPLTEGVVLSLGAGIYEELLFRVLLVGGMAGGFRASGLSAGQAGIFAATLAALIFSAFHYLGPYGDPWAVPSFVFRTLAGLAFSGLFLLRGFGITAWTHALYDVFLLFIRAG